MTDEPQEQKSETSTPITPQPEQTAPPEQIAPKKPGITDIIELNYDAWIVSGDKNELFDTTNPETAILNNFKTNKELKPIKYIIGSNVLWESLEKSFIDSEVGKDYEVVLKPQDAAGERKPDLIVIYPLSKVKKLVSEINVDLQPVVGLDIIDDENNRKGRITAITAGRVRIDFNHPQAGKTLKYKYRILKIVEVPEEQVHAILEIHFPYEVIFNVECKEREVTIHVPEPCRTNPEWLKSKEKIVDQLRNRNFEVIRFIEEYR